jgi:hypothetical protein
MRLTAEQIRPLLKKKPFVASVKDFLYSTYRRKPSESSTPDTVLGHLVKALVQMFGNDTLGDCVEAALLNALAAVAIPEGGADEASGQFTTDTAINLYSDITGYNPNNPNTDQGTVIRDALEYVRTKGVTDATGKVWKCLAYLLLSSWDEMVDALLYFGSVIIGLQLPESALTQFEAGQPWTVVASSPIAGGHCIVLVSLNPSYLKGVTWDELQSMVKAFYDTYCDEAWAILWPEIIGPGGVSPEGLDLEQLQNDLNNLGGTNMTSVSASFAITIAPAVAQLEITTQSLPGAESGVAYSAAIEVTGGVAPYIYSISDPDNFFSINQSGAITGTPTNTGTADITDNMTVTVTDSNNNAAKKSFRL